MRRGWTLHEMLISLGVMSGIVALAAHAATAQLRFFSDASELGTLRGQIGHASSIAASVLWGVSGPGGDILIAQDSAIEVHMPIAASFVCGSSPGLVTVAAGTDTGNTLASVSEIPTTGDRLLVLFEDSIGATWLSLRPTAGATAGAGCAAFPAVTETLILTVQELLALPAGAPLLATRRVRLSLYRSSDKLWYLGTKDWNGDAEGFNTIQPVAGPLSPYSLDPARTGLRFVYRDADGSELADPVEASRVASITVVARGVSARFEDSSLVTVSLPNAR